MAMNFIIPCKRFTLRISSGTTQEEAWVIHFTHMSLNRETQACNLKLEHFKFLDTETIVPMNILIFVTEFVW